MPNKGSNQGSSSQSNTSKSADLAQGYAADLVANQVCKNVPSPLDRVCEYGVSSAFNNAANAAREYVSNIDFNKSSGWGGPMIYREERYTNNDRQRTDIFSEKPIPYEHYKPRASETASDFSFSSSTMPTMEYRPWKPDDTVTSFSLGNYDSPTITTEYKPIQLELNLPPIDYSSLHYTCESLYKPHVGLDPDFNFHPTIEPIDIPNPQPEPKLQRLKAHPLQAIIYEGDGFWATEPHYSPTMLTIDFPRGRADDPEMIIIHAPKKGEKKGDLDIEWLDRDMIYEEYYKTPMSQQEAINEFYAQHSPKGIFDGIFDDCILM